MDNKINALLNEIIISKIALNTSFEDQQFEVSTGEWYEDWLSDVSNIDHLLELFNIEVQDEPEPISSTQGSTQESGYLSQQFQTPIRGSRLSPRRLPRTPIKKGGSVQKGGFNGDETTHILQIKGQDGQCGDDEEFLVLDNTHDFEHKLYFTTSNKGINLELQLPGKLQICQQKVAKLDGNKIIKNINAFKGWYFKSKVDRFLFNIQYLKINEDSDTPLQTDILYDMGPHINKLHEFYDVRSKFGYKYINKELKPETPHVINPKSSLIFTVLKLWDPSSSGSDLTRLQLYEEYNQSVGIQNLLSFLSFKEYFVDRFAITNVFKIDEELDSLFEIWSPIIITNHDETNGFTCVVKKMRKTPEGVTTDNFNSLQINQLFDESSNFIRPHANFKFNFTTSKTDIQNTIRQFNIVDTEIDATKLNISVNNLIFAQIELINKYNNLLNEGEVELSLISQFRSDIAKENEQVDLIIRLLDRLVIINGEVEDNNVKKKQVLLQLAYTFLFKNSGDVMQTLGVLDTGIYTEDIMALIKTIVDNKKFFHINDFELFKEHTFKSNDQTLQSIVFDSSNTDFNNEVRSNPTKYGFDGTGKFRFLIEKPHDEVDDASKIRSIIENTQYLYEDTDEDYPEELYNIRLSDGSVQRIRLYETVLNYYVESTGLYEVFKGEESISKLNYSQLRSLLIDNERYYTGSQVHLSFNLKFKRPNVISKIVAYINTSFILSVKNTGNNRLNYEDYLINYLKICKEEDFLKDAFKFLEPENPIDVLNTNGEKIIPVLEIVFYILFGNPAMQGGSDRAGPAMDTSRTSKRGSDEGTTESEAGPAEEVAGQGKPKRQRSNRDTHCRFREKEYRSNIYSNYFSLGKELMEKRLNQYQNLPEGRGRNSQRLVELKIDGIEYYQKLLDKISEEERLFKTPSPPPDQEEETLPLDASSPIGQSLSQQSSPHAASSPLATPFSPPSSQSQPILGGKSKTRKSRKITLKNKKRRAGTNKNKKRGTIKIN